MSNGVLVSSIVVQKGRRPVDPKRVAALKDSILTVGLLEPLVVLQEVNGVALVAGLHRLEAVKELGWKHVPVTYLEGGDGLSDQYDPKLLADLAEIDENLCRAELTVLERSTATARRKVIYEKLHPETRAGVAGGTTGGRNHPKPAKDSAMAKNATADFVADTSAKTGRSERAVRQDAQIGASLKPETVKVLEGTPVEDRQQDLLELAREKDPVKQVEKAKAKVKKAAQPKPTKAAPEKPNAAPAPKRAPAPHPCLQAAQEAWLAIPEAPRDRFRKALFALDDVESDAFFDWLTK